jgi:NAD(P)-dependent dehydrogenase (short-subunit alcohol dehydrogenase family)
VRFAEEGAAGVVVADLLEDAAAETVELVEAADGRAVSFRLNAANKADNEAMVAAAMEEFGRVDVLVTAAGVSTADYRSGDKDGNVRRAAANAKALEQPWLQLLELSLDEFQGVLDVNLTGTLLAVQATAAQMVKSGIKGSIITIASIYAKSNQGPVPYNVSKAGVWMLTKVAARMLAPTGIRVNAIGPGFVVTNMTSVITDGPEAHRQHLMTHIPMGRLGEPVEIANTALFLASDESSYFTGEILHPDGGFYTE